MAVLLALTTYTLVRSYLILQRENATTSQTFANARVVRDALRDPDTRPADLLASVVGEAGGFALLRQDGAWYSSSLSGGPDVLPDGFVDAIEAGRSGRTRFDIAGVPHLAVAVTIPSLDVAYVQVFGLTALRDSLAVLRNALLGAGVLTVVAGGALGVWSTGRALRPLHRLADTAEQLAGGDLAIRMPPEPDPDLDRIVSSFNAMADAVEARIERERRFTSDVTHELRTPLSALTASIGVLERRAPRMDPKDAEVVQIMVRQVAKFERMVADLLEMARLEAGAGEIRVEVQDLGALIGRIVGQVDPAPAVVVDPWWQGREVLVDKRRLERIIVNLVENARVHAGGATEVRLSGRFPNAVISVTDAGPGISETDRGRIFERFARGAGSQERPGSGLGLALVAEHVRCMGGSVEVRNLPEGGARFTVTVPVDVEVRG